jgi:hypothetical protein
MSLIFFCMFYHLIVHFILILNKKETLKYEQKITNKLEILYRA